MSKSLFEKFIVISHKMSTTLSDTSAAVGLSRTLIENLHLRRSLIGRDACVTPGERDPHRIDVDLNYGIDYRYGYSRDACSITTKQEMLARELIFCTFNPLSGDSLERCTPNQSAVYYRSFLDSNNTPTADIPVFYIDNKAGLRSRYDKPCRDDCVDDRYLFRLLVLRFSKTSLK